MADFNLVSITDKDGSISFSLPDNGGVVKGNKALATQFMITLLTNVKNSYLAYGFGGNVSDVGKVGPGFDTGSVAASLQSSCDATVRCMKLSQSPTPTEQIASAMVEGVDKVLNRVTASIRVVPVALDAGQLSAPVINLPIF